METALSRIKVTSSGEMSLACFVLYSGSVVGHNLCGIVASLCPWPGDCMCECAIATGRTFIGPHNTSKRMIFSGINRSVAMCKGTFWEVLQYNYSIVEDRIPFLALSTGSN